LENDPREIGARLGKLLFPVVQRLETGTTRGATLTPNVPHFIGLE
jgi:hypothetical protein